MSEKTAVSSEKKSEAKSQNSPIQKSESSQFIGSPFEQILFLQRTIGNQAVERLIRSGALHTKPDLSHTVSTAEMEADHVARRMKTAQESGAEGPAGADIGDQLGLRKSNQVADHIHGFMEPRFSTDFSGVNVHTEKESIQKTPSTHLDTLPSPRAPSALPAVPDSPTPSPAGGSRPRKSSAKVIIRQAVLANSAKPPSAKTAKKSVSSKLITKEKGSIEESAEVHEKKDEQKPQPAGKEKAKTGAKAPASPAEDPAFQAVIKSVKAVAYQQGHNNPARKKAAQAQAAAAGPSNEVASKAAAAQIDKMAAQEPQPFDRAKFKAALTEKIASITPKTLEEADDFKSSGKVAAVKGEVTSQVKESKDAAQGPIKETTQEAPGTGGLEPKPVTPIPPMEAGPPPPDIGAANATPKRKTESEVSLKEGSQSLDQQMTDAGVTEDQLKKSNEPEFSQALDAKKEAQTNAKEAPSAYRKEEQAILGQAENQAVGDASAQVQAMHSVRKGQFSQIAGQQDATKSKDEEKRAKIASDIENIYKKTKDKVEKRLNDLDNDVNSTFDNGTEDARRAFEDHVARRMSAYKDERYSGVVGAGLWIKDKFLDLPGEVNVFYQEGRDLYVSKMDSVIDQIALKVETGLTEARGFISSGLQEVTKYVNDLPRELKKIGENEAGKIQNKFDDLKQSVDEKSNQLVDTLAQKYVDNLKQIDDRINQMKEENKGLVSKAKDAVAGVIQTILQLKDMLLGVLARAASAIDKIIKDPIGFLGNLVAAVKLGLSNFMSNIGEHLQRGLMGWLFGALADAGIQMPESFDLKGIFNLILQVLGLTYSYFRSKAVKLLGEKVVSKIEKVVEVFKILLTEGPAGLWKYIKDKIGDLKSMVIDGIKNFVITKVIVAGITWLVSMLNPASAFIKAAKAIYDVVMFFVTRGSQILALVNAVIDSITAIASGAVGGAAAAVEGALSKGIPVAISFLASLLGLGGISEKIKETIDKVRAPIDKAIDGVVNWVGKTAKKVWGKLTGKEEGEKDKETKPDERTDDEKRADLDKGVAEATTLLENKELSPEQIKRKLPTIKSTYKMTVLELVKTKGVTKEIYHIHGEINPEKNGEEVIWATGFEHVPGPIFKTEEEMIDHAGKNNKGIIGSNKPSWDSTGVPYLGNDAQEVAYLETNEGRIRVMLWHGDQEGKQKCYTWRRVAAPGGGRTEHTTHKTSLTPIEKEEREYRKQRGEKKEKERRNREDEDDKWK